MNRTLFAAAALSALAGAGGLAVLEPGDAEIRPRRRNYDLEGPKPVAGPPTAVEGQIITRQQRRKLERQAAKSR